MQFFTSMAKPQVAEVYEALFIGASKFHLRAVSTSTHFNSDQRAWKSPRSIQPVEVNSRHAGDVSNLTYRFLETP